MSAAEAVIARDRSAMALRIPRRVGWAAVALLGFALAVALRSLAPRLDPPIARIDVEGRLQHLDAWQIASAAAIAPGTRIFAADLDAVRGRVDALPWVARVTVRRRWPDALSIVVGERQPLARWDDNALLDTEGAVFTPPPADLRQPALASLPRLSGPTGTAAEVVAAWRQLQPALAGGPFALGSLTLDPRGEWSATTVGGVVLRFGADDPAGKIELLRTTVTSTLTPQLGQIAAIDLRYTNGFAVEPLPSPKADAARAPSPKAEPARFRRERFGNGVTTPSRHSTDNVASSFAANVASRL